MYVCLFKLISGIVHVHIIYNAVHKKLKCTGCTLIIIITVLSEWFFMIVSWAYIGRGHSEFTHAGF